MANYTSSHTGAQIDSAITSVLDNAETWSGKQDKLTAGTGIAINGNVISNTQTSAEWGNITGTLSSQTDLKNALDAKQDTLIAGSNINIGADGKTISATVDNVYVSKNVEITGDGSTTRFTIDNEFNTRDVMVNIYNLTTYDTIQADVSKPTTSSIVIEFATAPASGKKYRVNVFSGVASATLEDGNKESF